MINSIEFKARSKSQSEILLNHSTGETTFLLFNSNYPLQTQEYYHNAIKKLINTHPDISPMDDLFSLFSWWFTKCALEIPLMVGTYRTDERKRIGEQIKKIREEKKIEARQLALMTGIDASNICRIEQGRHSVGIDILSKVANALGYKIELVKL